MRQLKLYFYDDIKLDILIVRYSAVQIQKIYIKTQQDIYERYVKRLRSTHWTCALSSFANKIASESRI